MPEQQVRLPLQWNFPLSGAVTMPITMPSANGAQFGLFNINVGTSQDSALEAKLIAQAGSYGKQIGRLYDVVSLMLRHMENDTKLDQGAEAVAEFRKMSALIAAIKDDHKK
jgi:hypothetical protein